MITPCDSHHFLPKHRSSLHDIQCISCSLCQEQLKQYRAAILCGMLQGLLERELEMALSDKQQQQTSEAKNAVEAYVYSLRGKLSDSLAEYATEEDKASISKKLTETEVGSRTWCALSPSAQLKPAGCLCQQRSQVATRCVVPAGLAAARGSHQSIAS